MEDHALTRDQLSLALKVQADLDAYGSALVPSVHFRETFGSDTALLNWLFVTNLWMPKYDVLLDLNSIQQLDGPRVCPIRDLAKRRRRIPVA